MYKCAFDSHKGISQACHKQLYCHVYMTVKKHITLLPDAAMYNSGFPSYKADSPFMQFADSTAVPHLSPAAASRDGI